MILKAKDIAEITRLLDESQFSELKLEIGDFKLRVSRGGSGRHFHDDEMIGTPAPAASTSPAPAPAATPLPAASGPAAGEVDVPAPLLGNFYSAPRPGDPPFVKVGDLVNEDSVIGIIEVMKLMNSVRAGVAGTVIAILAQNGTSVEEGQPLLRVKTGG
ncbi:acetyl-CoA carboxylase, biotin carboxyl carrier protein [Altererythrobacter sp. CC-YST694]|uniref:acetyl-CoA carboxylase biotin carboxyl carrier protein n=1 Tax=Altererythrobacter sp. CC-YST694 TaxID=2755038 RepID=UPI001D01347F|nr:biotin/lipoyl-containing protein [Altererythrobacter sp. CC-YST694]MCB5426044.1 acetyl-CoA carboxylase, biotin carboxyl carrier protein [Altererythrobacter sp. CC-YST694]